MASFYGGIVSPQMLGVDQDQLFWVRKTRLSRMPKAGGQIVDTSLENSDADWVGALLIDTDAVWVAHFGCAKIARFPKTGGAAQMFPIHDQPPFQYGGSTPLADDGPRFLCGNGPNIFAIDKASGAATKLVSDQYQVTGVARVDTSLYWINDDGLLDPKLMVMRGGAPMSLGPSLGFATMLHHDEAGQRLLWTTGLGERERVVALDLNSGKTALLAEDQSVRGGSAMDDRYLYWQAEQQIIRLQK